PGQCLRVRGRKEGDPVGATGVMYWSDKCEPDELRTDGKGYYGGEFIKRNHAQNPQVPKPDVVTAPASPQTEIQDGLKAEADPVQVRDAGQARLDAAQANTRSVLYKAMASSGIKPEDCTEGQNPFACIRRDPKTGFGFERKKVAEVKPDKPKGSQ